jgi:hypothetical protein
MADVLRIGMKPFASGKLPHCYRVEYVKISFIPNNTSKQDLTAQLSPSTSNLRAVQSNAYYVHS